MKYLNDINSKMETPEFRKKLWSFLIGFSVNVIFWISTSIVVYHLSTLYNLTPILKYLVPACIITAILIGVSVVNFAGFVYYYTTDPDEITGNDRNNTIYKFKILDWTSYSIGLNPIILGIIFGIIRLRKIILNKIKNEIEQI